MDRTKYLDSLKGLTAVIVAFDRLFLNDLNLPFRSYWAEPASKNRVWLQLPPFRIVFAAHAMVTLFFVISGYAVSINLLRVRQQRHQADFLGQVASAATRRVFRLFLPVVMIACVSQFLFWVNLYSFTSVEIKQFVAEHKIKPWSAPGGHLAFLFRYLTDIINPFGALQYKDVNHGLNEQFWTMPVEFRGSCLVYFLVTVMAPWRAQRRLIVLAALAIYLLWYGMWDVATFVAGLWLAEMKVNQEAEEGYTPHNQHYPDPEDASDEENVNGTLQPGLSWSIPSSLSSTLSSLLTWSGQLLADSKKARQIMTPVTITNLVLFALGIHLMCLPSGSTSRNDGHLTTGYRILLILQPSTWKTWEVVHHSWKSIGSVLVIYSINNSPRWLFRRPLEASRTLQYLGRISFPLHLIQQIVYSLWREPIKNWIWKDLTGYAYPGGQLADREPFACAVMWMGATMILGPVLVYLSEEVGRYFEAASVVVAREVETWLI
ncbi:hypothetical protein EYB25_005130 [Talaromyces marneffei]|uniref:Acyltransferase 3 domain-containing protein n=2 Tax=Talaromyces marneffei TaxID=37727 RepID=B6QD70_TALMQ|nr:uncharacterized protein EYB26_003820 [Talaromyces marneffei]EEA23720.1 conserved hypothetical protein [Talaromyces marneffei ATCC 18224]KAE8553748.1 hypothetical protein EYB25_005130 [Talaromyces marneffei]QGA16153.1 hypothetical protein EYB26_003820 [Talaromyces marneffei]